VRIFKEGIEKMKEGSMRTKLSRFLLNYSITPHTTTGVPPAELLMGRHLRTQLDLIQPNLGDRVREEQSQKKEVHDYHARERIIKTGNLVYAKYFTKPKSWMPGTVVKKTGTVSAEIQLDDGLIIRRHQDHLRIRTDVPQTTIASGLEDIQLPTREVNPAEPREEPELEARAEQRRQPHRDSRLPQHLQDYELENR
jgi:hypothetical protein